jgi:hypothetical protein
MLTSLKIDTDKAEYSRLESLRSVVRVRVLPTPATGLVGEAVVVSLVKKGVTIWSTPVVFSGDASKGVVVPIDLTDIKDDNGDTHISRGIYTVEATQGNVSATKDFSVALITAAEMRKSYCQGLHLVAGYKLAAKRQPSLVTGVTITDVSKGTRAGVKALSYDVSAKTLTWDNGPAITIEDAENAILIDAKGSNWIEVDIDPFGLPDADAAEGILLAEESLDDEFIRREIEKATQEAEVRLKVNLEPTRIATEPYFSNPEQGEYFDYKAAPVMYQARDFNTRGVTWQMQLPYHQVAKISKVEGFMGNTLALTITAGAITVNRKSGLLNILPYNSQYSYLYTFFAQLNFWGYREFIPDFWRYKGTIGVEENTPGDILKVVGLLAAVSILTTAEQAYRAGTTSESTSKDGVSHSRSYNAKGIYDTTIQEYKEWTDKNVPKLRNQYRGIPCVVM